MHHLIDTRRLITSRNINHLKYLLDTKMAYRCSGLTNDELVENMAANDLIQDTRVVEVRAVNLLPFNINHLVNNDTTLVSGQ